MTTDQDLKWKDRLDLVAYVGERMLYVTHEEWAELRDMQAERDRKIPPAVWDPVKTGQLGFLIGTPVIVDDAETALQRERFRTIDELDPPLV